MTPFSVPVPCHLLCAGLVTALWVAASAVAVPVGSAFTYQGSLELDGSPANGTFDMAFGCYDAAVAGVQQGATAAIPGVPVSNGRFAVTVDFAAAVFNGEARWLQVDVDGTPLAPRQPLLATPYAVHALNAPDRHSLDAADGDPVDALFVDSFGRVGIGTTTPGRRLTVRTAVGEHGLAHEDGTHNLVTWLGTSEGTEGAWIGPTTPHALSLQTSNVARMTISNGGNVGIGTTNPFGRLHLVGGPPFHQARIESNDPGGTWLHLVNNDQSGTDWSLVSTGSGNDEGAGNLLFYDWNVGLRMLLDPEGALGIGTAFPQAYLHVSPSGTSTGKGILRANSPDSANFENVDVAVVHAGPADYSGATVMRVESRQGDSASYGLFHVLNNLKGSASSKFYVSGSGHVGIGTVNTEAYLHVNPSAASAGDEVLRAISPAAAGFANSDVAVVGAGPSTYTGTVLAVEARRGDSSGYALLDVRNNTIGTHSTKFHIRGNGNVGIGTASPGEKLHVCGNVRVVGDISASGAITAAVPGACPDYVFDEEYGLMPLEALREYVSQNKHLPNVPPAAEVEAHGIDLAGFQMRLLEKTEELTLYTLAQDEALKGKDAEIAALRQHNASLEARLARLEALVLGGAAVVAPAMP